MRDHLLVLGPDHGSRRPWGQILVLKFKPHIICVNCVIYATRGDYEYFGYELSLDILPWSSRIRMSKP